MTRRAAVAISLLAGCLAWAGCASAEDANAGGDHDLSAAAGGDDLGGGGGGDLAHDGGAISCGNQHVVVNEVQVGSAASPSDEFIELYNPCALPIDLTGSSIVYRSAAGTTDGVIINLTKTIDAGGYLLIAGPVFPDAGVTADQSYGAGRLAAAGGGVGLRDGAQLLVDSVGYGTATNAFIEGSAAPAPANGQSIARRPNGVDTDHNGSDFAATTPTPRAAN
jgi:hypothetical protein